MNDCLVLQSGDKLVLQDGISCILLQEELASGFVRRKKRKEKVKDTLILEGTLIEPLTTQFTFIGKLKEKVKESLTIELATHLVSNKLRIKGKPKEKITTNFIIEGKLQEKETDILHLKGVKDNSLIRKIIESFLILEKTRVTHGVDFDIFKTNITQPCILCRKERATVLGKYCPECFNSKK